MKFLHLSDLHLGKRVNEYSMLEDQEYILTEILKIVEKEHPDGVLIAGDIYDKPIPGAEAVQMFDEFLCHLSEQNLQVFAISGNHDSPERIAFGSRLMNRSGVHLSPVYDGSVTSVTMEDDYGKVHIYLLPFLKPSYVRRFHKEAETCTYTEALAAALLGLPQKPSDRNILLSHQFVTGANRSESEELSVGGLDNVDVAVYKGFDYVALGHLHAPQYVENKTVRYCGTPLKYSFSEVKQEKSVTVVELKEKGTCLIRTIPLLPRRDMREIKGSYLKLTAKSSYEGTKVEDYLHITLTDEEDIPDAIRKLRVIYPNLMKLDYDNQRTRYHLQLVETEAIEQKSPAELFMEFYEKQNNQPMSLEQKEYTMQLIEKIWEEEL